MFIHRVAECLEAAPHSVFRLRIKAAFCGKSPLSDSGLMPGCEVLASSMGLGFGGLGL